MVIGVVVLFDPCPCWGALNPEDEVGFFPFFLVVVLFLILVGEPSTPRIE